MFFSMLLLCSNRAIRAATFQHIMISCSYEIFVVNSLNKNDGNNKV